MFAEILWYMFQPIMCVATVHDWVRVKGGERKCEYCGRVEVISHMDSNMQIVWKEKE